MGIHSNLDVACITPDAIVSEALALVGTTRSVDALVVACTNLRALEARAEIAEALGLDVVTANSAVAECALQLLGRNRV
jgi:maleate isomerase